MMLRRLKEDVEKKLAPKEETIIEVELTNIQKKYYRAILEKNFSFLSKGAGQTNVPNLVNTMMELRKCCNHPYLIKGAEEKILGEFRDTYNPSASDFHLQAMIQSAGKLVLIDKLLPKMKAGGHKVLIFSQMVRCLDILEDYLIHKRYLYERIDGRVRGNLRQAAIDRFSKPDSDRFVFLLCTRAGGLGINLTAADTCIIFDSDWNPQNDLQIQQLSKKEIEDLLRRGAYGAIMEEEDEGSKFCEEDIDQILLRRTKTITIESEGRGSTFAKNSLVIDTPRIRKQTRPFSATKDELAELSEAESEGEEKPKLRRPCDRSGYGRTECFRVEKNLLVYGWGRWREILSHGRFKRQLNEQDVEIICRALLAYCLVHYRGDEKIKGFIWDLITPTEDGQTRELQNHLGLSAPVPRGRKGKKVKTQTSSFDIQKAEWLRKYNPEQLLQDEGYKKHVKHHCNKVLLRVRMLYYLKQEVIGNECQKVFDGVDASDIDVWVPEPDHSEVPAVWWDFDADKSLLIGVFKHGYEKYNTIRADPALCFLERVGKPDDKAVAAEQRANDYMDGDVEDPEYKPAPAIFKDDIEDDVSSPGDLIIADGDGQLMEGDKVYWPTPSALTTRLRRLITAYQRTNKNRNIQQIQPTFSVPANVMQPVYEEVTLNPKMAAKIERQQRKVREQALRHPQLFERLKLCHPNPDLPIWWECGPHDRDLLIGAAKHGVSRTDYHILRDPELSFMAAQRNYSQKSDSEEEVQKREGAPHVKAYDEESVASLSTTQDETQDSFQANNGTPESAYLLQGGYMLAASYWPKDRVMINRLDSICQTVLKGKWPSARRNYDANTVASFYTTKLLDSPGAATEYSEPSVPTPPAVAVKEDHEQSTQMSKEGGLKLTFQKQGLAQKRPFDGEDGALGQQQYLTRLRELQSASETSLVNFPKSMPASGTSIQSTLGANGVILDNQPIVKKRRGRRKNVEGVDILFLNRNKPPNHLSTGINPALSYTQPQRIPDTESPVPVINLKDGTRLAGDDAPKRKDLDRWLKEHPGYVEDLGAFIPRVQLHEGRPKQKRHRCRNPNKLDVNSLTGEERVQLINRRNARKGFLPESMYERILTGPVVREEVSRRGRRPKSGISKATIAATAPASSVPGNPLLTNGLLPGVDLTALQALQQNLQNLQSLQVTAGLMGMPAGLSSGGETKNMAAMFPMLLSGMAGLPNLLGMGGLLSKTTESGAEEKKGNDSKELEGKKERTESQSSENGGESCVSGSPSTSSTAALSPAAAAKPIALNPLLLSNILYPGMLLTPGLNLHIPTLSQPSTFDVQKNKNSDLGSSKSVGIKEEASRVRDQEEKGGTEPSPFNENSTDEGSEKASSGSDSTSSSSEDSDSSNED
ncbi:hypothetical protein NN561_007129 [Cricetulus griseus]